MADDYHTKREAELMAEWRKISEQKPWVIGAVIVGAALFIANMTEASGPSNSTLGGIALLMVIVGGIFWADNCRRENAVLAEQVRLRHK